MEAESEKVREGDMLCRESDNRCQVPRAEKKSEAKERHNFCV